MSSRPVSFVSLFLVVASLVGIAWGIRLWTKPQIYNPDSTLHRQLYLWYVGWFRKKLDASYQLSEEEVRKVGLAFTLLGAVSLMFAILSVLLLDSN